MTYVSDKAREYVRSDNRSLEALIREVIEDCAREAQFARVECGDSECRGACCVKAVRALATQGSPDDATK